MSAEKEVDLLTSKHQKKLIQLKSEYIKNNISASSYLFELDKLNNSFDQIISCSKENVKIAKNEFKTFGFSSPRVFLIGFGIRFPYLIFSFIILFFSIYYSKSSDSNLYIKNALSFLYTVSFLISFYMIVWFMWTRSQDLPKLTYYILIGVISVLSTFIVICLSKYYNTSIDILKSKVRLAYSFIINTQQKTVLDFALKAAQESPEKVEEIKRTGYFGVTVPPISVKWCH
ncbi:hypothetical protein [Aquimarina algiphila]|uniref:Uncharacterized protein n=1 Tax=Aquimarina algiphila TaxID=2047982 RepID=A0A554VB00_9FLAO|nr:hypothetical protein [Aquimarina algiphila]TSE03494.1 hypothetical protein FOF46_29185 [Aquimarina algiphila]